MVGQDENRFLIVNVLENFLGNPKNSKNAENKMQWEFNCPSPTCRHDYDKFNLAYNSTNYIFKCWKCKYSGFVSRLVSDYGKQADLSRLKLLLPEYKNQNFNIFKKPKVNYDLITCDLPDGYLPLSYERNTKLYKMAYDYVTNTRKITPSQIDKFKIGYTESGSRKYRIILPSLNASGRINYYEARSYMLNPKMPYYKPNYPDVQDIIYNEYFINWDLTIYLVEGVFDSLRIPNSIPLLGKGISPLLIKKLLEHNSRVVLCLDSDAFKDSMDYYDQLKSLGLDVFFIDLTDKKDISKLFEDDGQSAVTALLKTAKKLDVTYRLTKILNE
jgi:hypothetical protein